MQNNERFNYLLEKYLSDNIDIYEREEFFQLLNSGSFDEIVNEHLGSDLKHGIPGNNTDLPPHIAQDIIRNIYNSEKNTTHILPTRSVSRKWYWMAAASVILVVLSVYYFSFNKVNSGDSQFLSLIPSKTIVQKNTTGKIQTVNLSDGTIVSLYPDAILHYPQNFKDANREVYLEGGGFFHVAKNPEKPFLVFYDDIVTKVLGTSFSIGVNQKTGNVEVSVSSGRVQVFENKKMMDTAATPVSVIVTRNQKAVYFSGKHIIQTELADHPSPEHSGKEISDNSKEFRSLVFDQERLENVFKQLEAVYGIEIVVENTNLNNCVFTGDISSQDLFTQLKIVCLTTNSSYEINGTKILISGKGCP